MPERPQNHSLRSPDTAPRLETSLPPRAPEALLVPCFHTEKQIAVSGEPPEGPPSPRLEPEGPARWQIGRSPPPTAVFPEQSLRAVRKLSQGCEIPRTKRNLGLGGRIAPLTTAFPSHDPRRWRPCGCSPCSRRAQRSGGGADAWSTQSATLSERPAQPAFTRSGDMPGPSRHWGLQTP